jgi:hypothetical protein
LRQKFCLHCGHSFPAPRARRHFNTRS